MSVYLLPFHLQCFGLYLFPLLCSLQHPRSRTWISTFFPSPTTAVKRYFKPSSIAALVTPNYGRLLRGWRDMVKWGHFAEGYLLQQCGSSQECARSAFSAVVWAGWVNVISDYLSTTSSQRQEEPHRESGEAVSFGSSPCTRESPLAHRINYRCAALAYPWASTLLLLSGFYYPRRHGSFLPSFHISVS